MSARLLERGGDNPVRIGLRLVELELGKFVPNPVISSHGFKVYHPENVNYFATLIGAEYEKETVQLLERTLKPGMTFVDCGASIGYYTLLASRCVGENGKVYAFEPHPVLYPLLVKNVEVNGFSKIVTHSRKAVGDRVKTCPFYIGSQSIHFRVSANPFQKKKIEVTDLDRYFRQKGWPGIHLMKIDVEGSEKETLDGMKKTVKKNSPKLILEYNLATLNAAGHDSQALFSSLRGLGYRKIFLIKDRLEVLNLPEDVPRLEEIKVANLFCCKKTSLKFEAFSGFV